MEITNEILSPLTGGDAKSLHYAESINKKLVFSVVGLRILLIYILICRDYKQTHISRNNGINLSNEIF